MSDDQKLQIRVRKRAKLYALGTCLLGVIVFMLLLSIVSEGSIDDMLVFMFKSDNAIVPIIFIGIILAVNFGIYKYSASYYTVTAYRHIREEDNQKKREVEIKEEQKLGFTYQAADSFYAECLKKKISDPIGNKADSQRALLLAKTKDQWNIPNVEERYMELFRIGQQRAQKAPQNEKDQRQPHFALRKNTGLRSLKSSLRTPAETSAPICSASCLTMPRPVEAPLLKPVSTHGAALRR